MRLQYSKYNNEEEEPMCRATGLILKVIGKAHIQAAACYLFGTLA